MDIIRLAILEEFYKAKYKNEKNLLKKFYYWKIGNMIRRKMDKWKKEEEQRI